MRILRNMRDTAVRSLCGKVINAPSHRFHATGAVLLSGFLAGAVPFLYVVAGYTLEWKDTATLYAPLRSLIVAALHDFRLPLWNPYEALGMPLFAQMMHGVLHPISLIIAFLSPDAALDVLIIVNVAFAAAGSAVLAQGLGISPRGSFLAGFAFATSGYVLSMTGNYMYLVGAATAPWAVAGIHASCARRNWRTLIWAALGTAMLFFAGDPQWAVVAVLIGVAVVAMEYGLKATDRAFMGIGFGVMIAGVQILPTLALWSETARSAGVLVENRGEWVLSPWRLPELVAPGFFSGIPGASLVSPVYMWLGNPGTRFPIPFTTSVFVGATTLFLAVRGAWANRTSALLGIGSIAFLWIALGPALGADQILRYVPVWGSFRYAEKLIGPFTLCVSLLAGFGADQIARGMRRWIVSVILGTALAAAIALAIVWIGDPVSALGPNTMAREGAAFAQRQLKVGLAYPVISLLVLSGIISLTWWNKRIAPYLGLLLVVLVCAESVASSRFALHLGAPDVRDKTPMRHTISGENFDRVIHPVPVERGYGPDLLDESDRLMYIESRMGLPSYNVAGGLDAFDGYTGLMPRRFKSLDLALSQAFRDSRWVAMRRFSATHVVLPVHISTLYEGRLQLALDGALHVASQPNSWIDVWALPHRSRAFFATDTISADSDREALQALIGVLMRGGSEVVVQGSVPHMLSSGQVLSIERGPEWLRVNAESVDEALLIVNDAFWPGWQARIDGVPAEILCADVAVRAILWPAGRHVLEMKYDPPEVRIGWLVSLTGALALTALSVIEWRRKRSEINMIK
jgi:hypothetical protein